MDISQAKEQIKQCVQIYLSKDAFGAYRMSIERQRPVFLLGAPGIGKTAIMEQIASELSLPLVSYSMTHHTRQSALGLPTIQKRTYQEKQMSVTDYTLSEIIVALYETMEKTGSREGILFLDEINCVSETLAPTMLQFLQYKTFGNHRIPEGWVIVTAGNPPQFNRSVREFDIVTLDRLKVMKIDPDYEAFCRYAKAKGLHHAVQGYLDLHREDFYILETTKDGRQYVTARGWEDLSEAVTLYEENGFPVDESLAGQYLRHERICMEFVAYYRLYEKYRAEYGIRAVLEGSPSLAAGKIREADMDERITVTRLLSETVTNDLKEAQAEAEGVLLIRDTIRKIRDAAAEEKESWILLEKEEDVRADRYLTAFLKEARMKKAADPEMPALTLFTDLYKAWAERIRKTIDSRSGELENVFAFLEEAASSREMLLFLTELTVNEKSSRFLFDHPSEGYLKHSRLLALDERREVLLSRLGQTGLTQGANA